MAKSAGYSRSYRARRAANGGIPLGRPKGRDENRLTELNGEIRKMTREGALGRATFNQDRFDALLNDKRALVMSSPRLAGIRGFVDAEIAGARRAVNQEWARSMAVSSSPGALWGNALGVNMRGGRKRRRNG